VNTATSTSDAILSELTPPAKPVQSKTDWKLIIIVSLVALVLVAILVGVVLFLAHDPARTANIRDIVIILFAFALFLAVVVLGVLLTVIAWQLQMLIGLLRTEIKPMLGNVNDMVSNVRGTTMLVTESIAKPTMKLSSFWAGVKGAQKAVKTRISKK